MKYNFPKDFWWGTASSAAQSEGGRDTRAKITWDTFYESDPIRFFDEVGADETCDFINRYNEDFDLMHDLNLNSFRTSIAWARLFPTEGNISKDAIDFYNTIIDEQIKRGILPIINLYHFDLPMYLQEKGGWENKQTIERFVEFSKACFENFGDRVKWWSTFNEPTPLVEGGYLDDRHYPNVVDFKRAMQVGYNVHVAHAKAVHLYKNILKCDGKIGIIHAVVAAYPRSQNPADLDAVEIFDLFFNRSFFDPIIKGEFPARLVEIVKSQNAIPEHSAEEKELIKTATIDFFGVNYYYPKRIKAKEHMVNPNAPFKPNSLFDYYSEMKGIKMNPHRGWEIYEKGLYDIAIRIRDEYGNIPWFVAENGMGVENEQRFKDSNGVINDEYRIKFIKGHLKYLHKAMAEGCNCFGYHLWTFLDNWSWINAYKNRYGFVELDRENGLIRRVKKSGHWIKTVVANKGFDD